MGELNRCNYCKYRDVKQVAEARGQFIRVREVTGGTGGVNVYQVPDCTRYYDLNEGTEDHKKYFKAWLSALQDHCVC